MIIIYRPISKLSNLSQVLEKVICHKLQHFVKHVISTSPHGFLKGLSVTKNLTKFVGFVYSDINKGKQVDTFFLEIVLRPSTRYPIKSLSRS